MGKHIFHTPADMAAHGLFRRFGLPVADGFQEGDMLVGGGLIVMRGGVFSVNMAKRISV